MEDSSDKGLKDWVSGYCTPEEAERVVNPQNSQDYLLRLRAVFIADHTRIWRVFLHLCRMGFLKPHFKDDTDYRKINGYRISQLHEFDADLAALNLVELSDEEYSVYYHAHLIGSPFWRFTKAWRIAYALRLELIRRIQEPLPDIPTYLIMLDDQKILMKNYIMKPFQR